MDGIDLSFYELWVMIVLYMFLWNGGSSMYIQRGSIPAIACR